MNELLKRGISAWVVFVKNKLAGAVMMFVSGLMMFLAAINGKGNDTKTLPSVIALAGVVLAFWAFYRLGYIKSNLDKMKEREEKVEIRKAFYLQIVEVIIYLIIMAVGVYLYVNESFTNKILDLMCGGFTIFNGVMGAIVIFKKRENKNFAWKFRFGLTIFEFVLGLYFIFYANSINVDSYMVMGAITTIAGVIEIGSALRQGSLRGAVKDSKEIVHILKNDEEDEDDEDDGEEKGARDFDFEP